MEKNILVTRSSMPEYEEYIEEIKDIWDSRWLTNMGSKHNRLIEELKSYLDVDHLDLLTNGHMALELTLQALNLSGEVITTPFTFISTTHAITRNGLTPVFCDIDPETYTMDPAKIEALITDKTCAIMPVHVYGNVCDVEAIEAIAKKHNLKVIYDAAHVFGVKYKGKGIGSFGDASCFSFHATKVFNTIEGGAAIINDPEAAERLFRLKDFGILDSERIDCIGPNAKMNEFCAAMGLCNLRHVDEEIAKRAKAAARYREKLAGLEGLRLNVMQDDVTPNYAYFPVLIDPEKFGMDRDELCDKLKEAHIFARKYFYPCVNAAECYTDRYNAEDTPIALEYSRRVMTLPMFADLSADDVDRICDVIRANHK